MHPIWTVPGAEGFLRRLVDALHVGENAVLCLPAVEPPGMRSALEKSIGSASQLYFATLRVGTEHQPARTVLAAAGPVVGRARVATAETVVETTALRGCVLWIEGLTSASWPAWRRFLGEYAQASRSVPAYARPVFVVPLAGELALAPPAEDIALRCHRWEGVLGELDMLLFAGRLLHRMDVPRGMRTLLAWTLVRVGLWDAELIERLAEASTDDILRPHRLLADFARDRGWTPETPAKWWLGTADRFDGITTVHSAILVLRDGGRRLEERLWRAQVASALPEVEAQRQELLEEGRAYLRPPFHFDGHVIDDPRDLEVGPLAAALSAARAPRPLLRWANRLRDVRNSLAHLRCAETGQLLEVMDALKASSRVAAPTTGSLAGGWRRGPAAD